MNSSHISLKVTLKVTLVLKAIFINIRLMNLFTQKNPCIEILIWLDITVIASVDIRLFEWWLIDISITSLKNSSFNKGIGSICSWIAVYISLKFLFLKAIISFSGQRISRFLFNLSVRNSGAIKFHQNKWNWWSMSKQKFSSKSNGTGAFSATKI